MNEDAAAKVVVSSVKEALNDMNSMVRDRLLSGRPIDASFLVGTTNELTALAEKWSGKVVQGKYGNYLMEAIEDAATDSGIDGALALISDEAISIALYNVRVHIKDILSDGIKTVNEVITNAIITGKSLKEISSEIYINLDIDNPDGITFHRADTIARNELFSVYRQTQKQLADEMGVQKFKLAGPVDDKTSEICMENVGKVRTQEEWEDIEPMAFIYGLHVNCRHTLDPVFDKEEK